MAEDAVDILVVGAGPTGLALAAELRRLGQNALLIDGQMEAAHTSRAAGIHARTLEVLEPLGVVGALLAEGSPTRFFRIRDRDRLLASVDFSVIPSRYPYVLMCPQDRTEAILLERLRALGGNVIRPATLEALRPGPAGVEVRLMEAAGPRTLKARWVVGCDGMHSRVRDLAGISFEGGTYGYSFVLADVRMDWPIARDEVDGFFSPEGLLVVAPLPGDRFRLVATVEDAPEHPSAAFMQALLDARGPTRGAQIHELVWSSRFRIHHRVAATLRRERVLLCGDAAHVHSPAGGQGMNTGIQDAISLAAPLVAALGGGGDAGLDAWAAERRATALRVVSLTHRMTRIATARGPVARFGRNMVLRLVSRIPAARRAIAINLAELQTRPDA